MTTGSCYVYGDAKKGDTLVAVRVGGPRDGAVMFEAVVLSAGKGGIEFKTTRSFKPGEVPPDGIPPRGGRKWELSG